MTAAQPTNPNRQPRAPGHPITKIELDCAHAGPAPAGQPTIAEFQPLDPGIVSDTIPAFFIGRNMEGFWVARDANGQIGGIFLLEASALSFARNNSRSSGCATIFPSARFELDLENSGNPLVAQLGALKRLARRHRRRMAALAGKIMEATRRRLGAFHAL
jgi:hypothetical protein